MTFSCLGGVIIGKGRPQNIDYRSLKIDRILYNYAISIFSAFSSK